MENKAIDPVTLEVIWNRFMSVANEQQDTLIRTAFSTIVRESQDLACGLFDTRGRMIAQSLSGTPGHINAMATSMKHFLAAFPPESLAPGDVLILISAVNWAVFSALSRRGLKSHPAGLMMFYVMSFGWLFISLLFVPTRDFLEIKELTFNGWMGIAFLGIFCSGLAYIAWYDALKVLTTAQTGVFLYIEPLVAVVVAFFILSEPIVPTSLFGGAIILFGVWLVNRR